MEKCKKCGHTLNDTDKFCPECGEKVLKRKVIYSPRAEDIIVVDETDKGEKATKKSLTDVRIINIKKSSFFVKFLRIIYQAIVAIIAILLLITGITSFIFSAPIFGITCILMIICLVENIHVFRVGRWKMFVFTLAAFFAIAILGNSVSVNEGETLEQQTDTYIQNVSNDKNQNTINNENIEANKESIKTLSKEEFVAQCDDYGYKDIARYPDNYKGQKAHFKGKVIQVLGDSGTINLRVNVTCTEGKYFDSWDDTIFVEYTYKDSTRILEDDVVDIYGTLIGIYTYKSVMNVQISIPGIYAEYIDINGLD